MPETYVVVIRPHPTDAAVLLVDSPPSLAATMGRFGPARYAGLHHGAYVIPLDQRANFQRFAIANHLAVVEDSYPNPTTPTPGALNPLPECASCGQPARRSAGLRYCPACGASWHPSYTRETVRDLASLDCPTCGTTQRDGFPRCLNCGSALPNTPGPRKTLATRQPLADPLPIAATIDETLAEQAGT